MLALCQYCTQHCADFCISDFQRLALKMSWFDSADFQMPPSDISKNLNILLANLNVLLGYHQPKSECKLHIICLKFNFKCLIG
jgi:hypothetical protein